VARRRRKRLGIIGASAGFGIAIVVVIVAVLLGVTTTATGSDQWIGTQIVLLGGLVLAAPIQIVTGIVLAAVERTRPFGVGFLIGSAIGIIVMAGACFAPAVATN
jgi:hypothetical protein